MPSEKLTRILQAKSPFNAIEIAAMSESEGWSWVYGHPPAKRHKPSSVCFTGFTQADHNGLAGLALNVGLVVVASANKSLLFLVAGDNPGPSKLAKAAAAGVPVIDRSGFIEFLETGEVPN